MSDRMTHILETLVKYNYLGINRPMEAALHDEMERYVAFVDDRWLARGPPSEVAVALHQHLAGGGSGRVVVLDESTGRRVDMKLDGDEDEVRSRYGGQAPAGNGSATPRRRGRPRLGVVGREVTLLPRHWAWLDGQRGGASATLRRLVDRARREFASSDRLNLAQDRTHRLMTALAGDRPGYEEACRALYSGNASRFNDETRTWPRDVREVVQASAADAFSSADTP